MNIYWLNPPPRTTVLVPDLGWMNFNTQCPEYNWVQPIIDWSDYSSVDDVVRHIVESNTNVLCISTYLWNFTLCHEVAEEAKRRIPSLVVIQGGPQQGYRDGFFDEHPYIDYLCYATGHGEDFLVQALSQIKKYGSILFPNNVPFLISRTYTSTVTKGKFEFSEQSPLENNIAYLSEVVSEAKIRNKKTSLPFETARGCPYSCTYCEWGGGTGTKVSRKPQERILREIDLISILGIDEVEIIDANFGIFNKDIQVLEYMVAQRKITGYPKQLMVYGLAKVDPRKKDTILDAMFREGLMESYSMSIQSASQDVLIASKRTDISVEDQLALARKYIDKYNASIKVEVILGLPESTLDTFYEEMDFFQECETWYQPRNIFCLLPNTEAYTDVYRDKYGIKSVKVIHVETEEENHSTASTGVITKYKSKLDIVVGTNTYTTEEWKEMFFMNRAQRVLGPKLNGRKASTHMREWFNRVKREEWYKQIDDWTTKLVNGELSDVDYNTVNGVPIENIIEENCEL